MPMNAPTHPAVPAAVPVAPWFSVSAGLEDVDEEDDRRPTWWLDATRRKILGIAGVGFFIDAYDLFIINPVATMLQFRLYFNTANPAECFTPEGVLVAACEIPGALQSFLKAAANIGSVIGQIGFGLAADALGRKAVYGKELMLIILATILCLTTPTNFAAPGDSIIYLSVFRILLGVGIGGDYPMSATVSSDRVSIRRRGTMLGYIFASQGWGQFVGALAVLFVLGCYKSAMQNDVDNTSKVDGAWRICVGLSLIPAFATLYQRLTLPDARRYERSKSKRLDDVNSAKDMELQPVGSRASTVSAHPPPTPSIAHRARTHVGEWLRYNAEWRHLKILLGTSLSWLFLDIAFYGITLNQNVLFTSISLQGTLTPSSHDPWEILKGIALGNFIIILFGFLPGYYFAIYFLDKMGRKTIQLMGFFLTALLLAVLAGKLPNQTAGAAEGEVGGLGQGGTIVCFTLLQFFFNFGANTTTYIYPAEVFPSRFKALSHGISAASGKVGAIISAVAFNSLANKPGFGTRNVLWIFFASSIAGIFSTLLLPESKDYDADQIDREELKAQGQGQGDREELKAQAQGLGDAASASGSALAAGVGVGSDVVLVPPLQSSS